MMKMLKITKASAGSGKTFNLALEFIKMIFDEQKSLRNAHSSILAITFTNKATEEMKERIVKELHLLARYGTPGIEKSKFMPLLVNDLKKPEQEIKEMAQQALETLLNDFSEFNVSTIDSFFQNVLRSFAYEVDIIDRFGLELDDDYVLGAAVQAIPQGIDSNPGKLDIIKDYSMSKMVNGSSWDVFSRGNTPNNDGTNIYKISKFLSSEKYKTNKQAFADYFKNANISTLTKEIGNAIAECIGNINSVINGFKAEFGNCIKGNVKFKELQPNPSYKEMDDLFEKLTKEKGPNYFLKSGSPAASPTLFDGAIKEMKLLYDLMNIKPLIPVLALLNEVSSNVEEFRKDNSLILLSDTNELLHDIIDKENIPLIYDRIGVRLRHFLIDEFQDTSKMQWENLRFLVEESLANGNSNLVIGDVKQSIYRFRNADPTLLAKQIFDDFRGKILGGSNDGITTNYRSAKEIVEFNNDFFDKLIGKFSEPLITGAYQNCPQNINKKDLPGYVKVNRYVRPDKGAQDEVEERVADGAIATIKEVIAHGYSYRDIAILVNAYDDGEIIVNKLMQQGIPVISDDMLTLAGCPAVGLVINVLRYIDTKAASPETETATSGRYCKDELARIRIIKLFNSEINNGASPSEALKVAIENFRDNAEISAIEFEINDLYALVESIIEKYVDEGSRSRYCDYLTALQDIVVDYTSRYSPDLHSFLKWWDGSKTAISSPDNVNAVKLMTIHKSKGLEFPIVLIPFANWDLKKINPVLWMPVPNTIKDLMPNVDFPPLIPVGTSHIKDGSGFYNDYKDELERCLLDNINKAYVAFTRPVRELHISYIIKEKKKETEKELYLSKLIDEILNPEEIYEHGSPTSPVKSLASPNASDVANDMPAYIPSARSVSDSYDENHHTDEAEAGLCKHEIMSYITTAGDIDRAVAKAVRRGILPENDAEATKAEFRGFLSQPEPSGWFAPGLKVKKEREIIYQGDTWRIDRVITTPDGDTIVIDFKFGEPEPKHLKQVRNYMHLLRECGCGNIEGRVWYPHLEKVVNVPFEP
ncbi:MAG: UvrD-helicase domain-containing protein [Muribaculaceae bacterium]